MPETATPTAKPDVAAPTPKAPAVELEAPDLAPEASVQAVVESFRHAGTSGVAGGAASGGSGGASPPGAPRWTPRPAVGARDLLALQRMAGNRAVSALVSRRAAPQLPQRVATPAVQRHVAAPVVQRQDTPKPMDAKEATGTDNTSSADMATGANAQADALKDARSMVVRADSSAKAASDLAAWARGLRDVKKDPTGQTGIPFVVITLDQSEITVYDREANSLGTFQIALPKGVWFAEGVFVTPPGAASSMRMRFDPKMKRFRPYENAAVLEEINPKPKDAKAGGGAPKKGAPSNAGDAKPGGDAGAGAGGSFEPAPKQSGFDLRKYMKNPKGLDAISAKFGDGVFEFLVSRTPMEDSGGGTGKGKGGPRSTGFAGELEGKGTPPNRPAWPVTMEGPKTLPIGGQGTFVASINWAAEGSRLLDMVSAQMGNEIFYRWEVFDISAQAKRQADKEAAKARQAKAAIDAMMGTKVTQNPPGGAGGTGGAGAAKANAKGASVVPPQKPEAVDSPNDKSLADEILERRVARAGSGTDVNGASAGEDFNRDFRNMMADEKRTWGAVGESKAETFAERRSEDVANLSAVALLPVTAVLTTLGASFRYASEKWSTDRQQQDIPLKQKGTFLIRVIASPRVTTSSKGEQIIRPSSVATQVVEVVDMERMIADNLRDPGTRLKELRNALKAAEDTKDEKTIKAAKAQLKGAELEIEGDPLELLKTKITEKEIELEAVKTKWEKYNIRGPILEVENQLETLKKRRKLYELQEDRRVNQLRKDGQPIVPAVRVNATLASELTGSPYPLLISVGPMGMAGTKHRWKVLDATSKKAEGFEGVGDTADEALDNAFEAFGRDAQYGRGIIGVQLPERVLDQLKDPSKPGSAPRIDRRYTSQPAGWAVARGRIDDLVMTLAAIGLFFATAGTAAAILGGVVAAAKLISRWHSGTLEPDVETISDILAVFGAAGAAAQGFAKGAEGAAKVAQAEAKGAKAIHFAGLKATPVGELFVLAPETAAVEGNLARATAALAKAGDLAKRVEWANEALGYAGLVWGNVTFLGTMADIASQEASGTISHSEARRQRANAIGGAFQNNGMFLAGNIIKGKQAKAAAKAQSAAGKANTEPSASSGTPADPTTTPKPGAGEPGASTTGGSEATGGTTAPKESLPEVTTPKEQTGPKEQGPTDKAAPQEKPTKGGPADEATGAKKPPEPNVAESQPGAKPGETTPGTAKPTEGAPGGKKGGAPEAPKPGSKKAKAAARQALENHANGEKKGTTVEEAIKLAGGWKDALKAAIGKLGKADQAKALEAVVETRDKMVNDTWKDLQKARSPKYDGLRLENAGTKSFSSDIDGTIRPNEGTEAGGPGKDLAEQVKLASEAAAELSKALRDRVGGETDQVIDTNIYSFIGEGRVKPTDPKAKGAQQQVDLVTGLAEQLRGQNEAQFKAFEERLAAKAGDPRVAAEAKGLLAKAREFHDARVKEWGEALGRAKTAEKGDAAQKRAAREELLGNKKRELSGLLEKVPPNYEAIAEKQAEINWFAPDAYATPSAFKQAVAHGQRLKGAPRSALEMKGPEIATKLRESAGKLKADDPRGAKLRADAELVESQQQMLDATVREQKQLQSETPMDSQRLNELDRRAARMRDAIAARAEKVIVAELLGETVPTDKPGPEQLSESAAASGANMGMLEDHVRHAADLDGKVKAAAKYAARIAMAEWLSGLRPAGDNIAKLLGEFVKSRWDITSDIAPEMLRDMFLRYAELTGQGSGVVHDKDGVAVGVTDKVKQKFVDDATAWARSTNDGIQTAAIGAKAFDNPMAATGSSSAPDAPSGGPGGGGGDRPAGPVTDGGGSGGGTGGNKPPGGPESTPAPSGGKEPPGGGPTGPTGAGGGGGTPKGRGAFPKRLQDQIVTLRKQLDDLGAQRGQSQRALRLRQALDHMLARENLKARDAKLVVDSISESLTGPAPVRDTPLVQLDPHDPKVKASLAETLHDLSISGDPHAEEYASIIREAYERMPSIDVGRSPRGTDAGRVAETGGLRARFLAALDTGILNQRAATIFLERMLAIRKGTGGEAGAVLRGDMIWIDRASGERVHRPGPDVVGWPAERGRAWWVDHIVELQHGGADEPSNYLPLSDLLNVMKSAAMERWTNTHREATLTARRTGEDVTGSSE